MNAPEFILEGVVRDLPGELYHAHEAMSASGAKKMLRSPQHYKLMRDQPSEPGDAMRFGTAVHCGVLEPDAFDQRICCAPKVDKRTKDGKAAWSEFSASNDGKLILDSDAFDRVRRCIDAVHAHPAALALLADAERELSLFWSDGRYKVPCKARYDARNHGGVIDLKTTTDASPDGFARQCASLLYHLQAAFYFSGAEHVLNATPDFFAFICAESEPPYGVACYTLPGNAIMAGARLANIALERYASALESGEWRGYPDTIESLPFPRWAVTFNA